MSRQLKKQQQLLLGIGIGFLVLIIAVFAFLGSKTTKPKEEKKKVLKTQFSKSHLDYQ